MAVGNNVEASRIRARQEKREKNTKRFFVFSLILIAIFFLAFMYLKFFNVKTIEFAGLEDSVYTTEEILDYTGIAEGDNLINIRSKALRESIEKKFSYVESAEIKKVFPSTLRIEFELITPAMSVLLGDDVFLLSSKGKVLDSAVAEEELPDGVCHVTLPFVSECIQGEKIVLEQEETLDILLNIYSEFEKNGLSQSLTELNVLDKFNIKARLGGRFDIIFGTYEEADSKVSLLSAVMTGDLWTDASGIIDVSDSREAAVRLTGSAAN